MRYTYVIPPVGGVKVEYHFRIYMVVVSEIMFQFYNNYVVHVL